MTKDYRDTWDAASMEDAIAQTTRNDTNLPHEEVARRLAGDNGVSIEYGEFGLRIERHVVEAARAKIAELPPGARHRLMLGVERALAKNIPRLRDNKLSARRCNETADDLVLWHILKETTTQ
jgi:hypothetical protein